MRSAMRRWGVLVIGLLPLWGGVVAVSNAADAPVEAASQVESGQVADAGIDDSDAGEPVIDEAPVADESAAATHTESAAIRDDEIPHQTVKPQRDRKWRRDPTVPRRPGSFLGGSTGAALSYAWYTTSQRDLELSFDLGPRASSVLAIRVGDALFEWFAIGFQVNIITGTMGDSSFQTAAFSLYLDTAFYPWRGLGLKPSVGLGFSYAQDGTESFEISLGGPATLAFGVSYEFRVSRFFTMGPMIQVSWTTGDDYDALYLIFALELLKWFRTAKG